MVQKTFGSTEQAFKESLVDAYAIYQLKYDDSTIGLRFMSYGFIHAQGIEPKLENYDLKYTGELGGLGSSENILEDLYRIFNIERPEDFAGHSLSLSDIVALKQNGVISYHYVDVIGFKTLEKSGD